MPTNQQISRRTLLGLMGAAGAAGLAGCEPTIDAFMWFRRLFSRMPNVASMPPCIVRPEQMEGPYFVDARLDRSDIRSDPSDGAIKEGTPLAVTFRVHEIRGAECRPLPQAMVDLWQCDALGIYSGVRDRFADTRGKLFLRGHQMTDGAGAARFLTIYPGWYPGRTVHLHFKIRTDPAARRGYDYTSQLYFDDALSDRVFRQAPYDATGRGRVRNDDDWIFRDGGDALRLDPAPAAEGWAAAFDIGLVLN